MSRDIIIMLSNVDSSWVTLNGQYIGSFERNYEVSEVFIKVFEKLKHSYNMPIFVDLYEDDYDLIEDNDFYNVLWEREDDIGVMFTEDELQVLYDKDVNAFIEAVTANIENYLKNH